ncbi:MAG: hypothetical protein JRN67_07895, partial [Nitrososphaerota archaeon]|nr:hypothetical protein [Nitrososphaerota archaeon]
FGTYSHFWQVSSHSYHKIAASERVHRQHEDQQFYAIGNSRKKARTSCIQKGELYFLLVKRQ